MTDEQKQRYRESEERYTKNMSDEKKQKNKEIIKKNTEKT